MVQLAILSGIYGKTTADFERSVPTNMTPIAEPGDGNGTGISKGYIRLIPGARTLITAGANDRGGYVWRNMHLRVIGQSLYKVEGAALTLIGDVTDDSKPVQFAEGFDRIGIASNKKLFYYNGTTLVQVTDPDLGDANSVTWSDGYFLTTDGGYIVATELNDPTSVDPLKYGSSEADPDPVLALLALRGEVFALNRYSIEKFINTGGAGFPFARSRGSQIPKGIVGKDAFTTFVESFAFCGSARNEAPAIYLAGAGQAIKISPRVVDDALKLLTDEELAAVQVENLQANGLQQLLIHLPTETWVYHWAASQLLDIPVWSRLAGGSDLALAYPARNFLRVGTDWWCSHGAKLGVLDDQEMALFGEPLAFQFDTSLLYNEGRAAVVHELELVTLTGRGANTPISISYTNDGLTWSQERFVNGGARGARGARPTWWRLGRFSNWRGFRFRAVAKAPIAFARLEARLESLDA